ncbi:MAG: cupin domain-containing protein [Candidatus Aenigmarchaeota archaeon]|nr:cupin domain-containing protein [Candidatus Aenigmarchaeota archaeon]
MADETPPTQRVGISGEKLQSVDLGPEIEGMEGRHLRLRRATLEPGGHNAIHSHAGRPSVVYVLEGTITEHRNGAVIKHPPGNSWFGNREVKHWIENKGTTPAVILVVDIFKEKP